MKAAVALLTALLAGVSAQAPVPPFRYGTPNPNAPGVRGVNRNGPTNPSTPQLNTPVNQTSLSRLATLNSVDDWCTYGPMEPGTIIGNVEGEVVAYCTKPRNNARVIVSISSPFQSCCYLQHPLLSPTPLANPHPLL